MPPPVGSSCIVLHGHLPFVHHPQHANFLEEGWFFEAVLETYLPLLFVLDDLGKSRVPVRLAVGLTPPLLEMMRAPTLRAKFEEFLDDRGELATSEVQRLKDNPQLHTTARHYEGRYRQLKKLWDTLDGDLVAGFKSHLDEGRLEILASAATHAILPMLATEAGQRVQIRLGVTLLTEVFDTTPGGFWLPECAYTPGLDAILQEEGVQYVILESHGLRGAHPTPKAGVHRPLRTPHRLAVFGRDQESSRQVWSSEVGYPGDPAYRELYRDLGFDGPYEYVRPYLHDDGVRRNLGLKYHQITGDVPLHEKQPYDVFAAREQARDHARDFVEKRVAQCERLTGDLGETPMILSPYDMELFGHWWYEGPHFLAAIFKHLHDPETRPPVRMVTPLQVLAEPGSFAEASPAFSTWGEDGYLKVWINKRNAWVLRHQHELERRMISAAKAHPQRQASTAPLLDQMLRELLLLQSSDWAFIIAKETSSHYATKRVSDHVNRFLQLEAALEDPASLPAEDLEEICGSDSLFPGLDYRVITGGPTHQGSRLGTPP